MKVAVCEAALDEDERATEGGGAGALVANCFTYAAIALYTGEPRPVTASQPVVAVKPLDERCAMSRKVGDVG